jgi:hypothetical protein
LEGNVVRIWIFSVSILLFLGLPLQAASTLSGSSLNYQPATSDRASALLQKIRKQALSGNLSTEDILKAAEQIRDVQAQPSITDSNPAVPALDYQRPGSNLHIPVLDSVSLLGASGQSKLTAILNSLPANHLALVKDITVEPPTGDPVRGQLLLRTDGQHVTLYGASDLQEAAVQGVAALVYDSLRGTPQGAEWQKYGSFPEFAQTYQAWVDDSQNALKEASQSETSTAALSRTFFIASLFSDNSLSHITTYTPAPKELPWQIQQGHYGFGSVTFDVYQNQIIHLAQNGARLTASAADIPSQWTRQGMGD